MNRKDFIKTTAIMGASTILPVNNAVADNLQHNGIDQLTDSQGNFIQQPLPYNENFLEPTMDEETVHIHHSLHHASAVSSANHDLMMINKALSENSLETVDYWTKKLSMHLSSHILHSIFWTNLSNKRTEPGTELLKQIERDFGSYDRLKLLIAKTSKGVDGNGWGVLGFHPATNKLIILQCENHEKLLVWGIIPILVIDVWEHSYYIKYRNRRGDFVDNLFNILNWNNVSERFLLAIK